jgi:hypothetical protein
MTEKGEIYENEKALANVRVFFHGWFREAECF